MKKLFIASLILVSTVVFAQRHDKAPMVCYGKKDLLNRLKELGETPTAAGINSDQEAVIIFVSKKGDFTILKSSGDNELCVTDVGEGWRLLGGKAI